MITHTTLATSRDRITLSRIGRQLNAKQESLRLLPRFHTRRVTFPGTASGTVAQCSVEPLLGESICRVNAGLLPIIEQYAADQQLEVHVTNSGPNILALPAPNTNSLPECGLTDFLQSHEQGLICYGEAIGPVQLLATVIQAYPTATIAIVCQSRRICRKIISRLRDMGIRSDQRVANCYGEEVQQVVIGTYTEMSSDDIMFNKRHIVLAWDALHAIRQYADLPLSTIDSRFRLFGLLPENQQLSPYEQDCLMAIFGPAKLVMPQIGWQRQPVAVAWLTQHAPLIAQSAQGAKLLKKGYWCHPTRNRRIAQAARAITTHNSSTLAQLVPAAVEYFHQYAPQRVAVVTDTLEHAITIAGQLLGWQLLMGPDANTAGFTADQLNLLRDRTSRWHDQEHVILTTAALDQIDVAHLDVMIWAGGGSSCPLAQTRLLCPVDRPRRLLLIDVDDRHHPQLRRWSRARRKTYEERDWYPPGVTALTGRIQRYLQQQRACT